VLFFRTPVPQPAENTLQIGKRLAIVRQKSSSPWLSYCR
jgi:hypothetical protein